MADEVIETLVKKIEKLEREVATLRSLTPLYKILNENRPAQFTAGQNNYDPGDYDVLRVSADAARTVTGIAGGIQGRRLTFLVTGSFTITFAHQNAGSDAQNRIATNTGANIAVGTNGSITFYYDITALRWKVLAAEL